MQDQLATKMREFAAEVHTLAYQAPAGQGEFALLQLSQRMSAEADLYLRRSPQARARHSEVLQR
jgi:hypothetical protein